ncbi:MAG: hypothetical protein IMY72_13640 [Bacteroidetes bacterium]|nr:hypothetical protein [Bacteroidota bacterium]
MKKYYIIITILLWSSFVFSQDDKSKLNLNGFLDTYHAVQSKSPNDFMSSRTRLRTELDIKKGKSFMFASLNAIYNSILPEQTKIELREVFLEYTTKNWNFKAGRQIVIWGISDGLKITDLVSPMDMTEFLARDYDDIRMPVNSIRVRYLNQCMRAEIIFIPVSSFSIVPYQEENPWSVFPSNTGNYFDVNMNVNPEKTLKNSEYGGRLSFFLSGIDFSLSALHTWNKMPIFKRQLSANNDTVFAVAVHNRMDMIGADFSIPIAKFVVRGEFAEYFGELQSLNIPVNSNDLLKRNTTNFLLGIDWYPGNEWTITAQYSHKLISDYIDIIENKENTALATMGITKKILRSTLCLSTFTYLDVKNMGFFNRTSSDYSLTDEIHIALGYDCFHGDKGMFGMYKNNSEVWFKAKYSF